MENDIVLGISTCLTGEPVRYDGGHKLNHYLMDVLGKYVRFLPVCPESECGLPIPREAMHLISPVESPRLVTVRTGTDHTERMNSWTEKRLNELAGEKLCGFVFKHKSPSSGMRDIKIYHPDGKGVVAKGSGIFAKAFMQRFPLLPVEDEGRLQDAGLRENFIERVFVYSRWQKFKQFNFNMKGLVEFHTRHKLLIMSHAPAKVSELGRLVSQEESMNFEQRCDEYLNTLMETLRTKATTARQVNTLQHVQGYFKKTITADEKQELTEAIQSYQKGWTPLIVPITLLNHHVRKEQQPYLAEQYYLTPHPLELMLRNHV